MEVHRTLACCREGNGTGVALPVDHLDREQVARLADTLRNDFGAIDVLVNDIPARWAPASTTCARSR